MGVDGPNSCTIQNCAVRKTRDQKKQNQKTWDQKKQNLRSTKPNPERKERHEKNAYNCVAVRHGIRQW
jgi:hypothetical protein